MIRSRKTAVIVSALFIVAVVIISGCTTPSTELQPSSTPTAHSVVWSTQGNATPYGSISFNSGGNGLAEIGSLIYTFSYEYAGGTEYKLKCSDGSTQSLWINNGIVTTSLAPGMEFSRRVY